MTFDGVSLLFFDDRGIHVVVRRWDVLFFLDRMLFPIKMRGELGLPKLHGEDCERHVCSRIPGFLKIDSK